MKNLFLFLACLLSIQSIFAADLVVPGVDTSKGIGAGDVKYNADGSMGVGDMKYDKNGATAGNVAVDKNNAKAGNLVASGGMNPELTPLKNAPTSGSATPTTTKVSGSTTAVPVTAGTATKSGVVLANADMTKTKTGPEETMLMIFAGIIGALMFFRLRQKESV
jgi:hypothetical protein